MEGRVHEEDVFRLDVGVNQLQFMDDLEREREMNGSAKVPMIQKSKWERSSEMREGKGNYRSLSSISAWQTLESGSEGTGSTDYP